MSRWVGPLNNPAGRVKCAQYNIAGGLMTGKLNAIDYEDAFKDGSSTPEVIVEYPAGHARRRADILPIIRTKIAQSLERRFSKPQQDRILNLCDDGTTLYRTPVNKFVEMLIPNIAT